MRSLLLAALLVSSSKAHNYNPSITRDFVKRHSKPITKYYSLIADICEVETNYGYYLIGDDGKSLGIMQFQIATARDTQKRMYPNRLRWMNKISDKRLAARLLNPADPLAVQLTALRFEWNRKRYGLLKAVMYHNGAYAVTPYGKIIRDANGNKIPNWQYVKKVFAKRGVNVLSNF